MFSNYLEDVLNEKMFAYYLGGGLCIDGICGYKYVCFRMDGTAWTGDTRFKLSSKEKKLVAQIYINNKTPSHSFYADAQQIVNS